MKKSLCLIATGLVFAATAVAGNVVPVPVDTTNAGDGIAEVFVPDDGIAEVFVPTDAEKAAIEAWKANFNK